MEEINLESKDLIIKNGFASLSEDSLTIWRLFKLFFVRFFSSSVLIYCLVFPLSLLVITFFVPLFFVSIALFSSSLLFSTFAMYGITFYSIEKSSIYKNINNLGISKNKIYFSIFLLVFVVNFCMVFYLVSLIAIFDLFGFVTNTFYIPIPPQSSLKGEAQFVHLEASVALYNWVIFIYYFLLITISTFAISLLFQTLSTSLRSFIFLGIFYVFITFFVGNTFYFAFEPLLEGNYNVEQTEFYVDPNCVQMIDGNTVYIYPQRLATSTTEDGIQEIYSIYPPTGFYGTSASIVWWMGLFLPSNYINMFSFPIFNDASIRESGNNIPNVILNGTSINGYNLQFSFFAFNNSEWLFVIVWPYVLILFYVYLAVILNAKKN